MITPNLAQIEKNLNKEYEKIGKITVMSAHEDVVSIRDIAYSKSIMEKINPLNNPEPIILSYCSYSRRYTLIDGYHRLKHKIKEREDNIIAIILDEYRLTRANDCLFSFLENCTGETITFLSDEVIRVNNKFYEIIPNEGCGGCGNGWSSIDVLTNAIDKEITIKNIEQKEVDGDKYELWINGGKIADVDTGWGNGYYGGDFDVEARF